MLCYNIALRNKFIIILKGIINTMKYKNLIKVPLLLTLALSSYVVNAEVSISGSYQFHYIDQDVGDAAVTGASNDYFQNDSKMNITFSKKTESGIDITMNTALRSNVTGASEDDLTADGHSLTLEGDFGYIGLGATAGIGDELTPTAADLIGPGSTDSKAPQFYSSTGSLTSQQASLINIIDNENNITYKVSPVTGLTVGVSYKDAGSGSSANDDETVFAGAYEFTSGDVSGTFAYASNSIDGATVGATGLNSSAMGITIATGPLTFIYADAEDDQSASVKTEATDFGVSYNFSDSLILAVAQTEIKESSGGETLDVTSVSSKYTIANGLDVYITYHDYDYKNGSSGATSDDGSATILSIEATF
jgi:hypothetical protein